MRNTAFRPAVPCGPASRGPGPALAVPSVRSSFILTKPLSLPVTDLHLSRPELFGGRRWTKVAGGRAGTPDMNCSDRSLVWVLATHLCPGVGLPGRLGQDCGVRGEPGRPCGNC